jgi:hypothetical protein
LQICSLSSDNLKFILDSLRRRDQNLVFHLNFKTTLSPPSRTSATFILHHLILATTTAIMATTNLHKQLATNFDEWYGSFSWKPVS